MDCLARVQRGVACTADSPPWAVPQNGMPHGRFRGPVLPETRKMAVADHRQGCLQFDGVVAPLPPVLLHRGWMCPRVLATGWRCLQRIAPCKKRHGQSRFSSSFIFTSSSKYSTKNKKRKRSKDSIRQKKNWKILPTVPYSTMPFSNWKTPEKTTIIAELVALGHYFPTPSNTKTHRRPIKNPSQPIKFSCTPLFEKSPIKTHRFCVLPLWKITHQNPSVSCTPPFEKSPINTHRFCVLPPLKNHPSKPIGFVYSPLWKSPFGGGGEEPLFRGGTISANTVWNIIPFTAIFRTNSYFDPLLRLKNFKKTDFLPISIMDDKAQKSLQNFGSLIKPKCAQYGRDRVVNILYYSVMLSFFSPAPVKNRSSGTNPINQSSQSQLIVDQSINHLPS